MKLIGKISMIFATMIIVAHMVIPHQHKAQLQIAIHQCLFESTDDTLSHKEDAFLAKIGDIIKHVNLGEKHLENFRVSNYKYEISSISIFEVPEILVLDHSLQEIDNFKVSLDHELFYISKHKPINLRLRAPPII